MAARERREEVRRRSVFRVEGSGSRGQVNRDLGLRIASLRPTSCGPVCTLGFGVQVTGLGVWCSWFGVESRGPLRVAFLSPGVRWFGMAALSPESPDADVTVRATVRANTIPSTVLDGARVKYGNDTLNCNQVVRDGDLNHTPERIHHNSRRYQRQIW